ncbi:Ni/Fe-hydrogenase, b-type cytochrome subunit [Chitinophaga sancti]|uniref:Ni/Fe-hydrogenase, b-type cytochrome subunit n=1 Tax=Chitinophaga sancti TaxID=1004 RepID=UPI002A7657A5|nr:Ni/Fe-hydrogenase, b-type cytochrome subunit [Chitinophaga sancti]WPQ66000.1 Ni/Fe-hydrogenase, b-type cytochrome subunit [Chitinophaga sancti]
MAKKYVHIHRLRRVYTWELPVRLYHWLNALVMVALIVTGFYISNPLVISSHQEASNRFVMGWMRAIHFIAAYVFFFNFIFRLYWGFVGNKYANWKQFIPTGKFFFKEIWQVLKIDILQLKGKEHLSVGHNALAGLIYFFTFIAFGIQSLTGFGLYASMSNWWFPKLFSWVPAILGGDIMVRQIHHWTMWFFILFVVIHVYLVFYHDYVEGRGETSSMVGGWKFIEEEAFQKDKQTAPDRSMLTDEKK